MEETPDTGILTLKPGKKFLAVIEPRSEMGIRMAKKEAPIDMLMLPVKIGGAR